MWGFRCEHFVCITNALTPITTQCLAQISISLPPCTCTNRSKKNIFLFNQRIYLIRVLINNIRLINNCSKMIQLSIRLCTSCPNVLSPIWQPKWTQMLYCTIVFHETICLYCNCPWVWGYRQGWVKHLCLIIGLRLSRQCRLRSCQFCAPQQKGYLTIVCVSDLKIALLVLY